MACGAFSHFRFISLEKNIHGKRGGGRKIVLGRGIYYFVRLKYRPGADARIPKKRRKKSWKFLSFPDPSIMEKEKKYSGVITPKTC